jgi:hypothetical protein
MFIVHISLESFVLLHDKCYNFAVNMSILSELCDFYIMRKLRLMIQYEFRNTTKVK